MFNFLQICENLAKSLDSLLSSNNANAGAQESRSRAFAIVGNRSVVGSYRFTLLIATLLLTIVTMEVIVFEVVSELRNCLNGVVVGHCVRSLPERAITPLH